MMLLWLLLRDRFLPEFLLSFIKKKNIVIYQIHYRNIVFNVKEASRQIYLLTWLYQSCIVNLNSLYIEHTIEQIEYMLMLIPNVKH